LPGIMQQLGLRSWLSKHTVACAVAPAAAGITGGGPLQVAAGHTALAGAAPEHEG
jgi:hypothetical protein